ncbi:MAG: type IX secretion system sortase PorU, partial [Bacteroidota bacterium]|nr:type IX secretion system sortase PorU [Bacteroidota bacterium]
IVFRSKGGVLREYMAFDGTSFKSPKAFGNVPNQNIHGLPQAEMVIVAHPSLTGAAERLAQFHRDYDGMTVHIVTPQQVYNEFSSGAQDVSAVRDMMKMFYDRASSPEEWPQYLLLFGDASYDYKDRVPGNTNLVPTYESYASTAMVNSFASDDYFAFLNTSEGAWADGGNFTDHKMDIAVGRIPAQNMEQANIVVDKILRYHESATQGDWRNVLCFIADDEDSNDHFNQSDNLARHIKTDQPAFNVRKIYLDAYKQQDGIDTDAYPDVEAEITRQMEQGALVFNYVGHGGEVGLTHEKVVKISGINSWSNTYKMPLFITATCEFSRHDDPTRTSAGELVLLNPNGGAVALFTTTRVAWIDQNAIINRNIIINNLFELQDGQPKTIGEAFMQAKNASGFATGYRSFS